MKEVMIDMIIIEAVEDIDIEEKEGIEQEEDLLLTKLEEKEIKPGSNMKEEEEIEDIIQNQDNQDQGLKAVVHIIEISKNRRHVQGGQIQEIIMNKDPK